MGVTMIGKVFHPGDHSRAFSVVLLMYRSALSALMLGHGWGKMLSLVGAGQVRFADPLGLGPEASLVLTVFAEVVCSLLLILGFGTRIAVIPLVITMVVAVLIVHSGDPFGRKELAILYIVSYLMIGITGAGRYSIDHFIYRKTAR